MDIGGCYLMGVGKPPNNKYLNYKKNKYSDKSLITD